MQRQIYSHRTFFVLRKVQAKEQEADVKIKKRCENGQETHQLKTI